MEEKKTIEQLEKENRILKREYSRLQQDLSMLSNLTDYASRLRKFNEERVVAANNAKSNFLANMSHEIRTPMNAIIGMDEMILRECRDPKIEKYAMDIRSASKTLLSIINDILDLSKIESGKMEIVPVEYETMSVFNDIANMTMKKAQDKGLSYDLKVSPEIPTVLFGDEIRIRQIMLNIINNAIKYTKEGGICISASYDLQREMLKVEVSDTGIGIREEDMEKLFQSFQRLEETKNRNIEGTGLGLNITKQLVEMMDGFIGVQSKYGKGTTFTAEVCQKCIDDTPIGDFSDNWIRTQIRNTEYRPRLIAPDARVLIVDDNEMNLEVMAGLLSDTRIDVTCASSGAECLEKLRDNSYDCIMLDQMMPGMSGTETLSRLREEKLAQGTPIIALTADAIVGARDSYLKEGFTDYLSKPVMYEELENMLIKHIDPSRILTQEQIDELESRTEKPVVLVINGSSDKLNEIKVLLGDDYKGVYVRDREQAAKYLSRHAVRYIIEDGGEGV
ncbi:MAG: response regulator [Lachnospiraceae bacterium]|nr:response regulator [Lachnospiraceae bacterium]